MIKHVSFKLVYTNMWGSTKTILNFSILRFFHFPIFRHVVGFPKFFRFSRGPRFHLCSLYLCGYNSADEIRRKKADEYQEPKPKKFFFRGFPGYPPDEFTNGPAHVFFVKHLKSNHYYENRDRRVLNPVFKGINKKNIMQIFNLL